MFANLLRFVCALPLGALRHIRSYRLTALATFRSAGARVIVEDPLLPVTIDLAESAAFILRGRLMFNSWFGNRERIYIKIGRGGTLTIDGDFSLGPGCRLIVEENAQLFIGGRDRETECGMTERSLIMVRRNLSIGTDLLCSWGAYITDSDWHGTTGVSSTEDTRIGNHVWLAPNCTVLKGSRIADGCILATGTVMHKCDFPKNSLIGGIPARVLAKNREWKRDLHPRSESEIVSADQSKALCDDLCSTPQ